jgi:hypothetical protein
MTDIDEIQYGVWIGFTLVAVTRIVERDTGSDNLVDHNPTISTSTDHNAGTSTTTVRGTVIVAPGHIGGARAWITDNIIDPMVAAAAISGEVPVSRITSSLDPTRAEYEYTLNPPPEVSPGGGVESARVTDITRRDDSGRIVRTISGEAKKGSAATAFAIAQEPTPGAGQILVTAEISEPNVSDGRVSFRYEMVQGVVHTAIAGAGRYITRFSESLRAISEGERAETLIPFLGAAPMRVLGITTPCEYAWTADIEWIGTAPPTTSDTVIVFPTGFTATEIVRLTDKPDRTQPRPGMHTERVSARFIFDTPQAIPNARQIPVL